MFLILRTESFAQIFFLLTSIGLLLYTVLAFYTYHTAYSNVFFLRKYQTEIQSIPNPIPRVEIMNKVKYILMWSTINKSSDYFGEGLFPFIDNKCQFTNCFLTNNKQLLNEDYKNFDAIVFNAKDLKNWKWKMNLPLNRLEKQKYIFYSTISSYDGPVCNTIADEYFNWTCTYRLDSDIFNPFIEVLDFDGNFIAPKDNVKWETGMVQLSKTETRILKNKTKAMAWIVKQCVTHNNRMIYAKRLQNAFKENSLVFDIYGCGFLDCPKGSCLHVLHDYYFYFAAEDSDSEDYVTKEILKAFNTFTVPIVKGGANYHKFIPEGSYIDAGNTSIDKLVARVDYIIRNPTVYNSLHRWRKYYHVRAVNPFHGFCKICEYLNDEEKVNKPSIKSDFRKWWHNGPLFERCFPRSAESLSYVLSYVNKTKKSTVPINKIY